MDWLDESTDNGLSSSYALRSSRIGQNNNVIVEYETKTSPAYNIKVAALALTIAPVAAFSADVTTGTIGTKVTFTDASTGPPASWAWDFGDGITSTSQNPTHVYVMPGSYTVTLTATNALGSDGETKADYIVISGIPSTLTIDYDYDARGRVVEAGTIIIAAGGTIRSSIAGARIIAGAGGITVAATGTLAEAYISSIRSSGSVDLSAGTYTPSAARWILTGVSKALKLATGHILYDLALSGTSSITLTANASVSHEFIQASELNLGGFALTYTGGGENWYDRKRLHKVKATSKPYAYVPGDRILRHLGDTEAPPQ